MLIHDRTSLNVEFVQNRVVSSTQKTFRTPPYINHVRSRWRYALLVSHIPIPGEDVHFRWGTSAFPVRMCILGEAYHHSQWGCLFHCDWSSLGTVMCLTGNVHPHREWGCASPGMHTSPGMHILTGNVHSLHRVSTKYRSGRFWRRSDRNLKIMFSMLQNETR